MRALVWNGGQALDVETLPDPTPTESEVVLDVEVAGICGSDVHGYRGHPGPRVPPLILGHEVVGRVDGDAYTVYPLIGCGACARCAAGEENLCDSWRLIGMHCAGVFAERVAVPRASLVALPPGIDPRRAVLTEPLACCLATLAGHDLSRGRRIGVLGCGPIGLLTAFAAARTGAEVVAIDPVAQRLAQAQRLGAAHIARSAGDVAPRSCDLVVDAAGFESTWRASIELVGSGGTVAVVGLGQPEGTVPMATIVRRGITVRGQFAYARADFARALEVLSEAELDLAWVSDDTLAHGARAFANLVERPHEFSKILLFP